MAFCLAVPIKIRIFADRNQIKLTKNERLSMFGLGMNEVLLIALVVLLLFGGKKIPELMNGLGKGVKSFKDGMKDEGPSPDPSKRGEKDNEQ
jgi:sec-independent protein translocase protein TatA